MNELKRYDERLHGHYHVTKRKRRNDFRLDRLSDVQQTIQLKKARELTLWLRQETARQSVGAISDNMVLAWHTLSNRDKI